MTTRATEPDKSDLVRGRRFATHAEAHAALFDYVETFYNRRRRHSSLGYLTPEEGYLTPEELRAAAPRPAPRTSDRLTLTERPPQRGQIKAVGPDGMEPGSG